MTTHLFHISDVHFGVEDHAALDAVARAVVAEQPDALVCTGDITQRAKHSEYTAAAKWFESLSVPVWLDPGNHDMPYYNMWERFTDPYGRYRKLHNQVSVSRFETEDVILLPLKTTVRSQNRWPWSDGVVTSKALTNSLGLFREILADGRTVIVTGHHPLLGPKPGEANPTIGGEAAFEALAEAGADAFLSGHVHFPIDEMREQSGKNARLIGAGTISTRLRGGVPPSYNVITCEKGGKISVELRSLSA